MQHPSYLRHGAFHDIPPLTCQVLKRGHDNTGIAVAGYLYNVVAWVELLFVHVLLVEKKHPVEVNGVPKVMQIIKRLSFQ
jgi:hypothetical protein